MKKFSIARIVLNIIVFAVSLTCIYPYIWLGYSSLKTENEFTRDMFSLPAHLEWGNYYQALIRSKILNYFFNTLFNGVTSVAVIVFFAFCIGYFLSRYDFAGKNFVRTLLMLGMIVPIHSLLVPMYIQYKLLGIVNHRGVVIFPYLGVMLPLTVFLIEAYVKSLPVELEQSSEIEGSSLFNTIATIIFPLCRPILLTCVILSFNYVWNEMPFSLVLNSNENVRNIAVGIMNFSSSYDVNWTQRIAACVVALLPVTVVYAFFSKQIIEGMTEGAIKG